MILDIVVLIILLLAIYKGYQRGLIVGIFSFIAIIIGLAAAIKLSVVVAEHLGKSVKISGQWLPVISFIIVFIGVVLLVRLGANLIQRTVELAMLGWINRLGGILFYIALYVAAFSVFLFYLEKMDILKAETIKKSVSFSYIQPWGPTIMNALGTVIPFFRDMFVDLESFFGKISNKISGL